MNKIVIGEKVSMMSFCLRQEKMAGWLGLVSPISHIITQVDL